MTSQYKFITKIGFSLLLFVGGSWLLVAMIYQIKQAKVSATWPTVMGQITKAELEENPGRWVTYTAKLRYHYLANGAAMESDIIGYGQIGLGAYTETREKAEAKLKKYPVQTMVKVFYNPQRPEQACLEPLNTEAGVYVALCGGGVMMLFALLAAKQAYHRLHIEDR